MNLVFIHGNFPGQFKDIAPALAQRSGGRTIFLTFSENAQGIQLQGVETRLVKLHRDADPEIHQYLRATEVAILKGQAVLRELHRLQSEEAFTPDVVICHGGMGYGLFVKGFLPQAKLISYMEWYFTISNSECLFSSYTLDDQLRLETRNLPLLQEMVQADQIVCPTEWQRQQFPVFIRDRIRVIFDGVDQEFFRPAPPVNPLILGQHDDNPIQFTSDQLLLTYGTRGMEPLRGFPEFMRAAAAAQQHFPELQVVVFGNDRSAYGDESPHPTGSWKDYMLEELKGQLDLTRLHFTGLLTYGELVQLFHRSDLHCYFTRPYVVSWGVFQAAACGARLLVNDFAGINEVFADGPEFPPVDLDNQEDVTTNMLFLLGKIQLKKPGKSRLASDLNLKSCLKLWGEVIESS